MKTYAEIEITFADDISSGMLSWTAGDIAEGDTFSISEQFVPVRRMPGTVTTGTPTANPGEISAANFAEAFNADYNTGGLFVIETDVNKVTIKSTNYDVYFDDESFESPEDVSAEFTAHGVEPFAITAIEFSGDVENPCEDVLITVTCNRTPDEITQPIQDDSLGNPFSFEMPRGGINFTYITVKENDVESTQMVVIPWLWNESSIQLTIDSNPTGSTVSANVVISGANLQFEYSLDGDDWQEDNLFTGLTPGEYTMYIRDQIGCVKTKDFTLQDVVGVQEPYSHISKSNSLRFAKRVDFGDCGPYKIDENTLSCEVDVPTKWKEVQQFQSCDVITTQIRSNYQNHIVVISGEVNPLVDPIFINVVQKSNNMGLKDRRDGILYDLPLAGNQISTVANRMGLYFESGNRYNFDTGATIGTYALYGSLPEWGVIDNWVKIEGSWYKIQDVIFDEEKSAEVLVVNVPSSMTEGVKDVSCFYNLLPYEVWEFTINMGDYADKNIQVNLNMTHDNYEQQDYISEWIEVKSRHPETLEIAYKNDDNTDIFYQTGIEHLIRIPYERISGQIQNENESYKTDTNTRLIRSTNYEADRFEFTPVTKEMMRKLVLALCHSHVFINEVRYVIEEIEMDGVLDESNLYQVIAIMVKAENAYSTDRSNIIFNEGNFELIGLIDSGNGYVKYV